jgi:hypothetical protein
MIYVIFTSGMAYDKNYLQQQPAVTAPEGLGTVKKLFPEQAGYRLPWNN